LDPTTNIFQEWAIPTANSNPYGLAITSTSGNVTLWGTEFSTDKVFAFSPASGNFSEYSLPHGNTGVGYISIEPSGLRTRVWFTETTRNANGEFVYDPASKNVTLYEGSFPAEVGGGAYGVYAITNSVWFAGFSSLVRWDRQSQQYTIWPLPVHGSSIGRFVTLDQYGEPWYTQGTTNGTSGDNYVGVLRLNSTFQEWRIPSVGSDPRAIAINLLTQTPWIAEQSSLEDNGAIARLDTSGGGEYVASSPITAPSGVIIPVVLSPLVTHASQTNETATPTTTILKGSQNEQFTEYELGPAFPRDAVIDSSGSLWVSEPGVDKIAELSQVTPDFALTSSPPVLSLSLGVRAVATITGASTGGYAGQVTLTVTTSPQGVTISSFNPNPISVPAGGLAPSTFSIEITPNGKAGVNEIIIQGSNGTTTHTVRLVLFITNSTSSTSSSNSKCLIATATYGSEAAPEVQLMRNFRDHAIMKTRLGSSFMVAFNAWYYSFSPYVASYLTTHWAERTIMAGGLYPLIGILYLTSNLYSTLSSYPELAVLLSGLLASSLIGAFYLGLPLGVIRARTRRLRGLQTQILLRKLLGISLLGGLSALMLGLLLTSTTILMASDAVVVISTIFLSAVLSSYTLAKRMIGRASD
jgi:peptide/nickel transport system substrate-binding protein